MALEPAGHRAEHPEVRDLHEDQTARNTWQPFDRVL